MDSGIKINSIKTATNINMQNNNEKYTKEQAAVIVGFFLILVVVVITLFRSKLFSRQVSPESGNAQESQAATVLGYKTINAKDLQKKILSFGKDTKITLLDVRPFESFYQEHIVDAINISPDEFPLSDKIDAHALTIVIAANPDDSNIKKIVDELKKENFSNFLVLAGGMDVWKQNAGTTVTYGDPNSFLDQSKVSYVEAETLKEAADKNTPMFIVDVRSNADFAKGHIAGAINIPAEEIEKRRSEITEKRVIVVGINELQEFQSSVQMADMLLVSPFVLKGAMPKWQEKGFPVVN